MVQIRLCFVFIHIFHTYFDRQTHKIQTSTKFSVLKGSQDYVVHRQSMVYFLTCHIRRLISLRSEG